MGDWSSLTFIISQAFMLLSYLCTAATYFMKRRPLILIVTIAANVLGGIIAFSLLGTWSGLGVCAVAIVRDTVSYFINKRRKEEDKDKITKPDWFWLILWITALVLITAFITTAASDGIIGWFYCFGSIIFTISIWQKNLLIYKLCGLIVGAFWVTYFACSTPQNEFGLILESCLRFALIIEIIIYVIKLKKRAHPPTPRC